MEEQEMSEKEEISRQDLYREIQIMRVSIDAIHDKIGELREKFESLRDSASEFYHELGDLDTEVLSVLIDFRKEEEKLRKEKKDEP